MRPWHRLLRDAPLRWRGWGLTAADEATARDVPLAVLVGDGLDAWTAQWLNAIHADADLCALLDAAFVPVAAERSEHPGLAALAQQVLGFTADAAGVPCLLVLLPGQPPLPFGATPYAPLRDAERRKGLARVLVEAAEAWRLDPGGLRSEAAELARTLAGLPFLLAGDGRLDPDRVLGLAEAQVMAQAHALEGGFAAAPDGSVALPRWPQPELLRLIAMLAARPDAAPSLRAHLERSLAALAAGGIRDQLGGGFHRAAADAGWREPLWEQRLGDQTRLALAFIDGHALTGQRLYRDVAEQALAWAVQDLAVADGRWALGRHAVSDGATGPGPGAFHRWNRAACAAVVGAEGADILARRFALDDAPGPLAVRGELTEPEFRRLPELVVRLAAARAERVPPPLDDRDDATAHGYLLAALHAAAALPEPLPVLVAARAALLARLEAAPIAGPAAARAAVAFGLAAAGAEEAATRWVDGTLALADDGLLPADDDQLVMPMPRDAEDTVDGPGAAGCLAQALAALGRRADAIAVARAHAGLLARAPAAAAGLCLALGYSASASK